MNIPFLDLSFTYTTLQADIDAAVARVLSSGYYIMGPEVDDFEAAFAQYCQADHCAGVANGLDALILSLRALGVGAGDEVIVPSNTFIATWLAVSQVGATIVPVEPDAATYNIDPNRIKSAITSKTRAIIAVHLYGQPANLGPLKDLCRTHSLALIEDAAQAHGARYAEQRIGSHGDLVCWSFYPGKNLGAFGDGGAVTSNNPDLMQKIRVLRNYGSSKKYHNDVEGVNSRLDPLQAAILKVKLQHLDIWTEQRQKIAALYKSELADTGLVLPHVPQHTVPAWHLFVVQTEQRDALQNALTDRGIGTLIHYPVAPHMQVAYDHLGFGKTDFPLAQSMADRVLSLPIGPHLTMDQAQTVCAAVKDVAV